VASYNLERAFENSFSPFISGMLSFVIEKNKYSAKSDIAVT